MQEKENVCVETIATEQGSEIHSATGAEQGKIGSTDLGKFKDVNALMQAYTALQAEFTRRSQRLKRYEKEEENQARASAVAEKGVAESEGTDASALCGQGPDSTEEESVAQVNEEGVQKTDDIIRAETAAQNQTNTATNDKGMAFEKSVAEQQTPSLYEQVMASEEVRLKVIGDYLSSLGKSGAPLLVGGKGVMQTPPKRPNSISDAGKMALEYLKTQSGGVAE